MEYTVPARPIFNPTDAEAELFTQRVWAPAPGPPRTCCSIATAGDGQATAEAKGWTCPIVPGGGKLEAYGHKTWLANVWRRNRRNAAWRLFEKQSDA